MHVALLLTSVRVLDRVSSIAAALAIGSMHAPGVRGSTSMMVPSMGIGTPSPPPPSLADKLYRATCLH
jgi:hypothetical protein